MWTCCSGAFFTAPSRFTNHEGTYEISEWGDIPAFDSVYLALGASAQWLAEEWKSRNHERAARNAAHSEQVRLEDPVSRVGLQTRVDHALAALLSDPEVADAYRNGAREVRRIGRPISHGVQARWVAQAPRNGAGGCLGDRAGMRAHEVAERPAGARATSSRRCRRAWMRPR